MKLTVDYFAPETSKENGCPIIFLHAMLDSRKTWKVVGPQIAHDTGRRVYCLDARNHGESKWTEDFTLQLMADDVREFLNENKIPKAIFVGSSMGGSVAMKIALETPELVEKLIVENMIPKPYPTTGWKIMLLAVIALKLSLKQIPENADLITAKKEVSKFLRIYLPHMNPNQNHEFGLEVMPLKEENGTFKWETNLDVIKSALDENDDFGRGLTGTYGGEALFLYGTKSMMIVDDDKLIPVLFPRAVLVPVVGAAHMTHFEVPEEFVKQVVKFINSESS